MRTRAGISAARPLNSSTGSSDVFEKDDDYQSFEAAIFTGYVPRLDRSSRIEAGDWHASLVASRATDIVTQSHYAPPIVRLLVDRLTLALTVAIVAAFYLRFDAPVLPSAARFRHLRRLYSSRSTGYLHSLRLAIRNDGGRGGFRDQFLPSPGANAERVMFSDVARGQ